MVVSQLQSGWRQDLAWC